LACSPRRMSSRSGLGCQAGPVTVAPVFTLYDYSFLADGAAVVGAVPDGRSAALAAARKAGIRPVDEGLLHADPYPSAAAWCGDLAAAAERRLAAVAGPVALVSHWPLVRDSRHRAAAPGVRALVRDRAHRRLAHQAPGGRRRLRVTCTSRAPRATTASGSKRSRSVTRASGSAAAPPPLARASSGRFVTGVLRGRGRG